MKHWSLAFLSLPLFILFSEGLSPTYSTCQFQKSAGESALAGCPEGTIYVSPSDTHANFTGIQEAINSIPEEGHAIILIGEGQYNEMINVMRSAPVTLLGQLDPATASLPAGNASQRNLVEIWNRECTGDGLTDEGTATLTVFPADYHPFGNLDFKVYNINFENRGCDSISPALVTSVTLANVSFYGCSFASWQDTLYIGFDANAYAVDSVIYGQTDFIFGFGLLWMQSVTIACRGCGGGITAWQGTLGENNGVYIADSRIIRSPDVDPTTMAAERCYLGRPWNPYSLAVFHKTYMDDFIHPAGFTPWGEESEVPKTTYYAEYGSYGPGGRTSSRVPQDHILTHEEARRFSVHNVFDGTPSWIDFEYKY